jgi:hypothetical protein
MNDILAVPGPTASDPTSAAPMQRTPHPAMDLLPAGRSVSFVEQSVSGVQQMKTIDLDRENSL